MNLPFPDVSEMPDPGRAREAALCIVSILDQAMAATRNGFASAGRDGSIFEEIDRHVYEYFCLSSEEVMMMEDGVEFVFSAAQPCHGSLPAAWKNSSERERRLYAETLVHDLGPWLKDGSAVNACLMSCNSDLALLRLTLCAQEGKREYMELRDHAVRERLAELFSHIHQPLRGNFQLFPDCRIFDGDHLYLVKPMQRRFWLRGAALADVAALVLDIQFQSAPPKERRRA
ncbi:MAG: hypothetical protein FWD68_21315 [Alphaproteobacteria bacterium]|nr:hypothetical protein [Alphaproteobacteria bacterium]